MTLGKKPFPAALLWRQLPRNLPFLSSLPLLFASSSLSSRALLLLLPPLLLQQPLQKRKKMAVRLEKVSPTRGSRCSTALCGRSL